MPMMAYPVESQRKEKSVMRKGKPAVEIGGIGTHQIDFNVIDAATRKRVIDCIEKNGKISVMIGGGGATKGAPGGGFEQLID